MQEQAGNLTESVMTLQNTRDLQTRVLKRVSVESPDCVVEQKQFAAG